MSTPWPRTSVMPCQYYSIVTLATRHGIMASLHATLQMLSLYLNTTCVRLSDTMPQMQVYICMVLTRYYTRLST